VLPCGGNCYPLTQTPVLRDRPCKPAVARPQGQMGTVSETVRRHMSVRAFLPTSVPTEMVLEILELARARPRARMCSPGGCRC
jgi:hypothetical protein